MELVSREEAASMARKFIEFVQKKIDEGKGLVWIDEKLLNWIDGQVDVGRYKSRTQLVEYAIGKLMKKAS